MLRVPFPKALFSVKVRGYKVWEFRKEGTGKKKRERERKLTTLE